MNCWSNFRLYSGIYWNGLETTTEILSQDSWSLGQDLNLNVPKTKSEYFSLNHDT